MGLTSKRNSTNNRFTCGGRGEVQIQENERLLP